jgi:hypothetical protein
MVCLFFETVVIILDETYAEFIGNGYNGADWRRYGEHQLDIQDDDAGSTKLLDCPDWAALFYDSVDLPDDNILDLMKIIEEEFNCSGMCNEPQKFYYFSNVNK